MRLVIVLLCVGLVGCSRSEKSNTPEPAAQQAPKESEPPALIQAQRKQAKVGLKQLRQAMDLYMVSNSSPAPNLEALQKARLVKPDRLSDPWKRPYRLVSGGAEPKLCSDGPDRKSDTPDDICDG